MIRLWRRLSASLTGSRIESFDNGHFLQRFPQLSIIYVLFANCCLLGTFMKEISKRGRVVGTLSRSPTIRKAGCHPRDWVSHILAFSLWVFIAFVHLHVSYTSKDWVSHILAFSLFGFSSSVFAHVVLNASKYLVPYILKFCICTYCLI